MCFGSSLGTVWLRQVRHSASRRFCTWGYLSTVPEALRVAPIIKPLGIAEIVSRGISITPPIIVPTDLIVNSLLPVDKAYILNWLFKHAANVCPPTFFADEGAIPYFRIVERTRYKLYSRFQIKYRSGGGGAFRGSPVVLHQEAEIGTTNEPIWGMEVPGEAGPLNRLIRFDETKAMWVNDGTPDFLAVRAFNTLVHPLKWSHIGSRIEMGPVLGTGKQVFTQVYPTYFMYSNRSQQEPPRFQASEPLGNFSDNPYPPGPAPFVPQP